MAKRKYPSKTLVMLMAASTVRENFVNEKEIFIEESSLYDDPYADEFKTKIDQALSDYFGINSNEQLKATTRIVTDFEKNTRSELAKVKTQVERGYREEPARKDYVLDKLGYKEFWKKAENQTDLISLAIAFANNMDEELSADMAAHKVSAARINAIVDSAAELKQSNITQEMLKGSSQVETEQAVNLFNSIYDQTIDICKVGRQLFKSRVKKDLFNFAKIVRKQESGGAQQNEE